MKLSQIYEGFWLEKRKILSTRTCENYEHVFKRFVEFLGDVEFEAIKPLDVRRFLQWLDEKGLSARSQHDYLIPLSSLWTWAISEEIIEKHVIIGKVKPPVYVDRIPEPFTADEVAKMIEAARYNGGKVKRRRPTAQRDVAILLTLADCGLRASELCGLSIGDYEAERGRFCIRRGKGRKERYVAVGDKTKKALWRYLLSRPGANGDEPLFATATDNRMERHNLGNFVKGCATRAGVKKAHPHRFRHFFAIEFLRGGGGIHELKEILGHSTLQMVLRYARLAEIDIEKAGRRYSPADRLKL